ncbi:PP2C family protein-serine/threonine phosphatase [Nonomuraea dietziae]|uniref:PP2C family protein-serine/threonine phosphatase n=1 Tax=Nonomuraea dietziae TaxID=65515 RepID=UPI003383C802
MLEIAWPHDLEPPSPQIRKQVEALAELVAHTLEVPAGELPVPAGDAYSELVDLADGLHDPALVLTPHLDGQGHLVDFHISHANGPFLDPAGRPRGEVVGTMLLETYPLLAGDGGIYEKVQHVYATGEPFRADRMALTTLVDQVPLSVVMRLSLSRQGGGVLVVWAILDETTRLARLLQHAQRLGRIGGFEEDAVLGEITWNEQLFELYGLERSAAPIPIDRLAEHAHPDDVPEVGRFLRALLHHRRPASLTFRLLRPDGISRHIRVIAEPVFDDRATLLAIRGAFQDISAQHWTEVALAATQDQLVQTEQQAAEQNRLALQLQQAIMPPTRGPMDAFDLQIAVRYRPAEKEHLVGGDWYDAMVLPSKQILLSVGDVAGHGIEAATGMVILRNALRGLAVTGAGPAQLMSWLNLVTHQMIDNITATAVCALYNPETRVLRWARARASAAHPDPRGQGRRAAHDRRDPAGRGERGRLRGGPHRAAARGHAADVHRRPDRADGHDAGGHPAPAPRLGQPARPQPGGAAGPPAREQPLRHRRRHLPHRRRPALTLRRPRAAVPVG